MPSPPQSCRAQDQALKLPNNADLTARDPAAALLAPDRQVLCSTRACELSNARHMSESALYEFFRPAAASARARP